FADQVAAHAGNRDGDEETGDRGPRLVHHPQAAEQFHIEAERGQRADIGADAEERDVAEAELSGIAEQQIEAHRRDDEDAGRDQDVEEVLVPQPERNGEKDDKPEGRQRALHPTRSARANRPVGLNSNTTMMIRKPIASRYPEET